MLLLLILADDFTGALDTGVSLLPAASPPASWSESRWILQPVTPLCWWWTPRHAICPLQRPMPSLQN